MFYARFLMVKCILVALELELCASARVSKRESDKRECRLIDATLALLPSQPVTYYLIWRYWMNKCATIYISLGWMGLTVMLMTKTTVSKRRIKCDWQTKRNDKSTYLINLPDFNYAYKFTYFICNEDNETAPIFQCFDGRRMACDFAFRSIERSFILSISLKTSINAFIRIHIYINKIGSAYWMFVDLGIWFFLPTKHTHTVQLALANGDEINAMDKMFRLL